MAAWLGAMAQSTAHASKVHTVEIHAGTLLFRKCRKATVFPIALKSDQLRLPRCTLQTVADQVIAKHAGTLLFSKCSKAIPNSFVNTAIISMILVHMLIY